MALKIEQTVVLEAPPERVWALLTDPREVATCLPGAAITEQVDERTWRGTMTVKVGPVTTSYKGTIRFDRLDPDRWEAGMVGSGQDVKGRGGAEMRMQSRLQPTNGGTEVRVASEVSLRGLLAQLGRGMIESVSTEIFRQFAANMQQKLAGAPPPDVSARSLDALSLGARAMGQAVKRFLGGETDKA
jgi:carbon monoxide dehydrogenase subunit G